jgi:multidrug efflux pump subunit AcrA (membrane-fusion protein)
MVRIDPLRFQGRVPETRATSVRVGQPIFIQIEGETAPVVSEVVRVSPALDVASRSLHIEAEIANPTRRLRSGLFAEGWVEVDPLATTLALPASAVGEFAGVHKVWVVAEQGVEPRRIEIGRTSEQRVEILAGLSAGEQVLRFYAAGDVRPTFDLSNNE